MAAPILLTGQWIQPFGRTAAAASMVALVVFTASLFGIFTRPMGSLAAFWPANAILLGIMVRNRALPSMWTWTGAFVGYIAADLMTGGDLGPTLWLTAANMVGAMFGVWLYGWLPHEDRALRRPISVLYLFFVCVGVASIAAIVGGAAARFVLDRDFLTGLEFWFVTELVNSLVILPAILTFPGWRRLALTVRRSAGQALPTLSTTAPVLALLASVVAGVTIGGPGALAFPVPALLWCALTYRMFTTSVLSLLLCGWLLIGISGGMIYMLLPDELLGSTTSIRLGVTLIALGPLTVASINTARAELLARLEHAVDHDHLTGVLARGAFMRHGGEIVGELLYSLNNAAVLMLDIDHFKQVNDRQGHAFGDRVLKSFARIAAANLRAGDLLGRTGGEEFAILLPGSTAPEAMMVAERVRKAIEENLTAETGGSLACITVSIGVSASDGRPGITMERLLAEADSALYEAKFAGRNKVMLKAA